MEDVKQEQTAPPPSNEQNLVFQLLMKFLNDAAQMLGNNSSYQAQRFRDRLEEASDWGRKAIFSFQPPAPVSQPAAASSEAATAAVEPASEAPASA